MADEPTPEIKQKAAEIVERWYVGPEEGFPNDLVDDKLPNLSVEYQE